MCPFCQRPLISLVILIHQKIMLFKKKKIEKPISFLDELSHINLSNHNIMTTLPWLSQLSP